MRFSSYSTLKQLAQGSLPPGSHLPGWMTFAIGSIAGVITVYTTMPLDVIKTRMQTVAGRAEYKNALQCGYKIIKDEGVLRLWKGTVPRLGRLVMSGGIVFYVYEQVYPVVAKLL